MSNKNNEQLAVAPQIAEELQELIKTTAPGSKEEAEILSRMREARAEASAETTANIKEGLAGFSETGELRVPRKAAQDLSHYAVEKATSGEQPVPTDAELAEASAAIALEDSQANPHFFDQENH
jgi:hypothetical protein